MRRATFRFTVGLAAVAAMTVVSPRPVATQINPLAFDQGASGLGLALRQLPIEGSVLYVTAHPDDENNGVLVALNRGRGLKTSLLTTTRGDGGQNEIGPELFQAIGILRGEELMAVHKYDGADQYHTRAFEFGYSFSVEETLQKWGHDEILGDMVRVIRRVRPDVILTMNREGTGGGQHHQTSARLAQEAFRVAADPTRYAEQIREGLRPWQPRKIYQAGNGPGFSAVGEASSAGSVRIPTGEFDPLLGMTWEQFGQIARGNHKCQGTGQLEAFPGDSAGTYVLYDSQPKVTGAEPDLMDGVDLSIGRLASFVAGQEAKLPTLADDLAGLTAAAKAALDSFDARAPKKSAAPITTGLGKVRQLRDAVRASTLTADAKAELDWRLTRKEDDFMKALRLAQGVDVRVTSPDGDVVRGQSLDVTTQVFNVGTDPLKVDAVQLNVPQGWTATLKSGQPGEVQPRQAATITYTVTVGPNTRYSQPYWKVHPGVDRYDLDVPADQTLPWSPPDITATVRYATAGTTAWITSPAYYRYDGPWVGGEKQKVVNVVPSVSVHLSPDIAVVPIAAGGRKKEFRVSLKNNEKTGGAVQVKLAAPAGWTVTPATTTVNFSVENEEMSAQFFVTPPLKLAGGVADVSAIATRDGKEYREGYQVIAYNHIQERHLFHPATSTVKIIDVNLPASLRIGYVMGTGDETAEAIRQLGATVEMLTPSDVAFGDLTRFSTIVLGIRAYEVRGDVRGYNERLLDFARGGGHLVVQYNKSAMNQLGAGSAGAGAGGFRGADPTAGPGGGGRGGRGGPPPQSPYLPFPASITSNRVTVEEAPIRIVDTGSPVLTEPNKITVKDYEGWVQERGLYFFGANDPRYKEVLAATDPWPYNAGEKVGLLTTAQLGKGTWTYVGLGLWRQLPAGTPGAYRILANLIAKPRLK